MNEVYFPALFPDFALPEELAEADFLAASPKEILTAAEEFLRSGATSCS